jgi:hypothetical protein
MEGRGQMKAAGATLASFRAAAAGARDGLGIRRHNGDKDVRGLTVIVVGYYTGENAGKANLEAYEKLLRLEDPGYQYIFFPLNAPPPFLAELGGLASDSGRNVLLVTSEANLGYVGCFLWGLYFAETPFCLLTQDDCHVTRPVFGDVLARFPADGSVVAVAPRHPGRGYIDTWCIAFPKAVLENSLDAVDAYFRRPCRAGSLEDALRGRFPNKAKFAGILDPLISKYGRGAFRPFDGINAAIEHRFLGRYRRDG